MSSWKGFINKWMIIRVLTLNSNITMDTNPVYETATAIKMDVNTAYAS